MLGAMTKPKLIVVALALVLLAAFWLTASARTAEGSCWYASIVDDDHTGDTSIPNGGTIYGNATVQYRWLYYVVNPFTGDIENFYCVQGTTETKSTVDVTFAYWGGEFYLYRLSWVLEDSATLDCATCKGGSWQSDSIQPVMTGAIMRTNGVHKAWQGAWLWYRTTEASFPLL